MTPTFAEALTTVGNPDRFSAAMRNVYRVRPRVPVDTWTDLDAAMWWHKDYQPGDICALPPSMILGVVARLFMRYFKDFRPARKLWQGLGKDLGHWVLGEVTQSGDLSWNLSHFCGAVHASYCPKDYDEMSDHQTSMSCLSVEVAGYCGRKTCAKKHSWYRGCMRESEYERLANHNLLRSWGLVEWGGLGMLFPPLRHSLHSPYLSIRKARSHITKPVVPYYVADKVEFLHRFAPAAMSNVSFQNWIRPQIAKAVDVCSSQRMRYQAIVALDSESTKLMRQWDQRMTRKMWDLQFDEATDLIYEDYGYGTQWGVDRQTLRQLQENPPIGMFPSFL